ncbi:hypothetical protein [Shewanella pneumatophori]|uniref:Uncharacterized protein n=1 Tax=Shewanella pneumatophori TaxID=314092 RepID=A0A9X1ZEI9_9GAMM|nr:hypothetical protein [Shewanella pneumatophori]MCL1140874.1 hypothetical protein [Shewanella pneumatophori]
MKNKNALIILERPWNLFRRESSVAIDQNVVSVLPYFQGLERTNGNFDLYHTNFYEAKSFDLALDELTQLNYANYYVYIACHGSGLRLGGMNLTTLLGKVSAKAKERNIVGVLLGSCLVGKNTSHLEVYTESSSIVWQLGYKCSVDWLEGTLLDLKFFNNLMVLNEEELADNDSILDEMKSALSTYNPMASIGVDKNGSSMLISESLTAIIQPKGKGQRAKDYSHLLFE